MQGDIPAADVTSGRVKQGYTCNARMVSQIGSAGGYRVERYVDRAGHVCAFFDSGTLFPNTIHPEGSGVWALDMTVPAKPRLTATLSTPAMLSPHESLRLNTKRGLLVAALGNPATNAGIVDVYSVKDDCRAPKLLASTPLGILGHESAFAPDGKTFYVTSTQPSIAAIDLSDPSAPGLVWFGTSWRSHGASVSEDGTKLYLADYGNNGTTAGMTVLDVSQVQRRLPQPLVTQLGHATWPEVSLPQNATPFQSRGRQYVLETDEFGGGDGPVGGARIIDVQNPRRPVVVSHLRLAVHNTREGGNKTAHYCTVPSRLDPYIVACGMLTSGLRVFDVRDVTRPREVAYANFTGVQTGLLYTTSGGAVDEQNAGNVYSAPAYDPDRNDIWYSDGTRGFFAVHLTPESGVTRFARAYHLPGS